jgi:hypothetical protein
MVKKMISLEGEEGIKTANSLNIPYGILCKVKSKTFGNCVEISG